MSLNIKTPNGLQEIGKVTKEKISTALGYDPASIDVVDHIDANVKEHTEDNSIHISSQDRQRWDAKADLPNIVDDASAQLAIVDTAGNKIASVSDDGISTTKVTAKELVVNGTNIVTALQELDSSIGEVSSKQDTHKNNTVVHITANERDKWNSKSDLPNITDDQSDNFILSDSSGNIIFKVAEAGSETTTLAAKAIAVDGVDVKQKLTDLEESIDDHYDNSDIHVTSKEKDLWTNKSDFSGQYADLNNAPNIYEDNSDSVHFADKDGNRIVTINKDGIHTTEVTANKVAAADMRINGLSVSDNLYTSEEKTAVDKLVADSFEALRDNAPVQLDTLNKIAAAINNNGAFADSVEEAIQDAVEEHASSTTLHMTAAKHDLLTTTASEFDLHSANSTRHITADERTSWNAKSDFSGNYSDLYDAPSITNSDTSSLIVADVAGRKIAAIDADGIETTKVIVKDDLVIADGTADGLSVRENLFTENYKTDLTNKADQSTVDQQIDALIDDAPAGLNTLNKIAVSINNDSNYAATVDGKLDTKLPITTFTDHLNSSMHITSAERAQISANTSAIEQHKSDSVSHVTAAEKEAWNNKSDFSGEYAQLQNAPDITNAEDKSFIIIDPTGFKVAEVSESGLSTKIVATKTTYATDDFIIGAPTDEDSISVKENLYTTTRQAELDQKFSAVETNKASKQELTTAVNNLIDGEQELTSFKKVAEAIEAIHEHSNMTVLDSITADDVSNWDSKAAGDHDHKDLYAHIEHQHNYVTSVNTKEGAVTLDANDIGALPNTTKLADLETDTDHRTVSDAEKSVWDNKAAGDHNHDLIYAPIEHPHNYVTSVNKKEGVVTLEAGDVGALPDNTKLADLEGDEDHRTVSDAEKAIWDSKAAGDHTHALIYAPIEHPHNYVISVNEKEGIVTLDASDVGALPSNTKLADLSTDADHRTVSDTEKAFWDAKAAGDHTHDGAYAPPQHEHPYITSVNGDTGPAIVLSADEVGALPASTTLASLATTTGDANHRLVTEEQMSTWDSKADGDHDHNGIYEPIRPKGYVESIKTSDGTIKQGEVTLTATDVNALSSDTILADLQDDKTHRLVTDDQISAWDGKEQRGHKHKFINRSVVSDTGTTIAFNIVSQDATTTKEDLENSNIPADFSQVVAIDGGSLSVGSADKLTAARTINLTGDVSGNGTFDGSQDINIEVTVDKDKVLEEFQANLDQNFVTNNALEGVLNDYALKTDLPSVPDIVDDLENNQPTADKTLSARLGKELSEQIKELTSTVEEAYATKDYVNTDKNKVLDYIEYTVNEDHTVTITGCDTSISGAHVIPSTIEGYPVTAITGVGDPAAEGYVGAFQDCWDLTSLTLPDTVITIGDFAFRGSDFMTSINIPDGVITIGECAFYNCRSLTAITIPNSITTIGDNAFYNCRSITSINIPDSVTSIGGGAFGRCTGLTSVTIPGSVTTIRSIVFNSCDSLQSVTIPNSVTSICWGAFSDCQSLTDIFYKGDEASWQNIVIEAGNNEALLNATIHYNQAIATEDFVNNKIANVAFEDVDTKIADAVSQQFNLYDTDGDGSVNRADVADQVAQPLEIFTSCPIYNTDSASNTTKITGIATTIPSSLTLPVELAKFGNTDIPGNTVIFSGKNARDVEAMSILGGKFVGPVLLPGLDVCRSSSEEYFVEAYGDHFATNVADVNNIANEVVEGKLANLSYVELEHAPEIAEDGASDLIVVDRSGNIIAKIADTGLQTTQIQTNAAQANSFVKRNYAVATLKELSIIDAGNLDFR